MVPTVGGLAAELPEESLDVRPTHRQWMSLATERDEAAAPEDLCLLRATTAVQRPKAIADLVEKSGTRIHAAMTSLLIDAYGRA